MTKDYCDCAIITHDFNCDSSVKYQLVLETSLSGDNDKMIISVPNIAQHDVCKKMVTSVPNIAQHDVCKKHSCLANLSTGTVRGSYSCRICCSK